MPVSPRLAAALPSAAEDLEEARNRRDRLIVQALDEGASLREVAALVNLTGAGVSKIRDRMKEQT